MQFHAQVAEAEPVRGVIGRHLFKPNEVAPEREEVSHVWLDGVNFGLVTVGRGGQRRGAAPAIGAVFARPDEFDGRSWHDAVGLGVEPERKRGWPSVPAQRRSGDGDASYGGERGRGRAGPGEGGVSRAGSEEVGGRNASTPVDTGGQGDKDLCRMRRACASAPRAQRDEGWPCRVSVAGGEG